MLWSGILTIHQMLFTGYNMLSHNDNSMYSGCQYGGFFVVAHNGPEYFKICSNITKESIFANIDYYTDFVFITFQGYSSGYIHFTSSDDEACPGANIAISRGLSCNNVQSTLRHHGFGKLETCSDVWLLNNIGAVETSHFENCSFAVDHSRLPFPSGPFEMITSTLVNIHSSFSSISTDISGLGYINVEMDVLQNFPIHTTTEKVNFSVPLLTQHKDNFNLSIFTVFCVSYSGPDRFPILAIRVQFIENVMCTRALGPFTEDHYINNAIHIVEDARDVYLPRNYPHFEIARLLRWYEGYNRGTCRALISGHKCSQLISHYQIIRIHHQPHKSLVLLPLEIDISMKKTVNCSIKCSLDIEILEYTYINDTRRYRYHEWKKIYRLTWQVIAAKSRGFSVIINSTCDTCAKLCDIAVAVGLPLTSNHMFSSNATPAKYLDILTEIIRAERLQYTYDEFFVERAISNLQKLKYGVTSSDHMYGNWYDANAYCLARNSSLVAHTPGFLNHLMDETHAVDSGHGWKKSQEHYFAGFHRDTLVSGLN